MTDQYSFAIASTLELRINGKTIATLPFSDEQDAIAFGKEWVKSRTNHPAGKRRIAEPSPNQ